jgi:SAM-dependent methyltransferase
MGEHATATSMYNEGGQLANWSELQHKALGETWVDRAYALFKDTGIIPEGTNLGDFRMLVAASNVPAHAVYFAKNLAKDFMPDGAEMAGKTAPVVVALDIALDPLKQRVTSEDSLERVRIVRVNADSTRLPFTSESFDLITDFEGALWYKLDSGGDPRDLLTGYFDSLKAGGSLVIDNVFRGCDESSNLFTGGMLARSGIITKAGKIDLGDNRSFSVEALQGIRGVDSFLVLHKDTQTALA